MITGRQIRAARALLGWEASVLAEKASCSRETISNIENGTTKPRESTINEIARVFNDNGVEFTDNQGVKLKPHNIEIFEGPERFDAFYNFIYEHLLRYGGDVCCSLYDESVTARYRKAPELHRDRMKALVDAGKITFRILATKSDFVSHGYAQFKWIPTQPENPTGFYAFGDCLALMSFIDIKSPYIVVILSAPLAEGYRQSFNFAWEAALPPPEKSEKKK